MRGDVEHPRQQARARQPAAARRATPTPRDCQRRNMRARGVACEAANLSAVRCTTGCEGGGWTTPAYADSGNDTVMEVVHFMGSQFGAIVSFRGSRD